jgi:hypothetical protein
MLATVNLGNVEAAAEGLLIALDARKAFDSVSHAYIKKCLRSFGCERFSEIFEILYSGLNTNIIVNGRIVKGFNIKRGVKQGDALSCIIFIMCMEPFLKNVEENNEIEAITSNTLGVTLPKAYGYADDFNLTVKCNQRNIQLIFREYERLSTMSGLVLNADKTEIMRIGIDQTALHFRVRYLETDIEIFTTEKVKINGISFQANREEMINENVRNAIAKAERNFKSWSRRSLSIMGKILICKTFGISQIIHVLQAITIRECHIKQINAALYKFIWNRHYLAAKAPERIKREIVCTTVRNGGFGMLDVKDLDKSLKLKMFGRMLTTRHPFLRIIREKLGGDFFNPILETNIDECSSQALESLKLLRDPIWGERTLDSNLQTLMEVRRCKIQTLISENGRRSIAYFNVRRQGKRLIGDLSLEELELLSHFIKGERMAKLRNAVRIRNIGHVADISGSIIVGGKFRELGECSTKAIREVIGWKPIITSFKIGLELGEIDSRQWLNNVHKLTSIRHRTTILKVAHGDIYTQERLTRFGLIDDVGCPRCDLVEDLPHKIYRCVYVKKIWSYVLRLCQTDIGNDRLENIMGIHTKKELLCVHAEILARIISIPKEGNYLLHPKYFVKLAIKNLFVKERNQRNKIELEEMLRRM